MLDSLLETQIQEYLAGKDAIVAAYLFGSAAMEQAHPLSDLYFSPLLDASLDKELAFNLRLETMATNLARLARRPVDVVLLN